MWKETSFSIDYEQVLFCIRITLYVYIYIYITSAQMQAEVIHNKLQRRQTTSPEVTFLYFSELRWPGSLDVAIRKTSGFCRRKQTPEWWRTCTFTKGPKRPSALTSRWTLRPCSKRHIASVCLTRPLNCETSSSGSHKQTRKRYVTLFCYVRSHVLSHVTA